MDGLGRRVLSTVNIAFVEGDGVDYVDYDVIGLWQYLGTRATWPVI